MNIKLGTEINTTTKDMSEYVVQPGIESGSPDYRSDAGPMPWFSGLKWLLDI